MIDKASGRVDSQETIRALDTLDERILAHLTSNADSNAAEVTTPERSAMPRLPDPGDSE